MLNKFIWFTDFHSRFLILIILSSCLLTSTTSWSQIINAQGDSLVKKSQLHFAQSQFDKALSELFKACTIFEKEDDNIEMANCYNRIGLIYERMEEYERSRPYYNKALAQLKLSPDKTLYSYVMNNIGMLLQDQMQLDSALIFFDKTLKIKRSLGDSNSVAGTLNNIGAVHLSKKNYPEALVFYKKCEQIKRSVGDSSGLFLVSSNIANIYGWLGKLDSVKFYLDKGMSYKVKSSDLSTRKVYHTNYAAYYKAIGDYKKAVIYMDSAKAFQNQIFHNTLATELSKYEALYNLEKKDQEIEKQRIKNKLLIEKQRREKSERYILILIIVSLTLFIIFFFMIVKSKLNMSRQKQELLEKEKSIDATKILQAKERQELLEIDLEMKSKKLIGYSTLTLRRQEMMTDLSDRLNNLEHTHKNNPEDLIKDLKNTLKVGENIDEEWENFKIHFEQVNHAFFDQLSSQYPKLTTADHRHCAYIKIGLTTKEIASLLNITPASVQKARVRLKKKLELTQDQDLYDFIQISLK